MHTSAENYRKVRVDSAGRMVLPADMRKALNLVGGQELLASIEGGRIRLQTIDEGLAFVRKIAKRRRKGDESVVDAFIAERRAESSRD
ncbi:MAG: AbrB/MazE/SpoVT family DNA-binding domain-containing protein [Gammaproteobacteria bacterium]|nr:AbrB/MazE/SpoVT family DNA-binding domain-containing protein [Gammaproteobacteria bacterium]